MDIKEVIYKIEELKKMEENKVERINEFLEQCNTDVKEIGFIYSNFGKLYSINKDNREYLIDNFERIYINGNLDEKIKNMLLVSYIDAQYKNYNYKDAEKKYKVLINCNIDDFKVYIGMAEYCMITRRYDNANDYFEKSKKLCNDDYYLGLIEKKEDEMKTKKDKGGYLPASSDNKKIYKEFMNTLGIEIELPVIRTKAPDKIPKGEYPKCEEIKDAGFKTFVAFDLETTGRSNSKDSIIEIAAIRVINGKVDESNKFIFQELVHPYKSRIPVDVEKLTGITNEMVYESREIWEVFNDFADWLGDDILLGYNCMSFDCKFMERAGRLSNRVINNQYFDVMKYAKKNIKKFDTIDAKLVNVGISLGIENPQAHRALADAITTARVYLKILELDNI